MRGEAGGRPSGPQHTDFWNGLALLLRARRQRPCRRRAAKKRNELAPSHLRPPISGGSIVSGQASTSIGAETGTRTIAAVHSQCPVWVIHVVAIAGQN